MRASNRSSRRFVGSAFAFLGSISVGIAIMTALAVAMGWATFLEREMGTPVAQYIVYAARWFYALIALLAVNILCAALVRLPRFVRRVPNAEGGKSRLRCERALAPFFFAHLGILLLLVGCFATARHSTKARAIVPEGTATKTAIDVDSRLFDVQLTELAAPKSTPTTVSVPFSGGPLNWTDFDSAKNWRENVAEPLLAQKPEGKFFQDLAKTAAKISQRAAYGVAKFARKTKPGVIYDADGLKIETLDYSTYSDFAPVPPFKADLTIKRASGETKTESLELAFPFDMGAANADPESVSRRAVRKTLDGGLRVVYMLADSTAEANAFTQTTPEKSESTEEGANDVVVLLVDGKRYQTRLEDLDALSRYGSPESQAESLRAQQDEIKRRLEQERGRTDVAEDAKESAKPLATVTHEALLAQNEELRKLSDELTVNADDATDESADPDKLAQFAQTRREFEQKRVLNYLTTTWAQLESATPTSREFCETLDTMARQTTERLQEVEKLLETTKLGDSGWKIVGFETSPTLLPGVEELQGWSASIQLETPQGKTCETTLFSEQSERNRYPENGRVFGALWVERASGSDNEFGRKWNESLGKPKIELIQTTDRVLGRYNDGTNAIQTFELELTALNSETPTAVYRSATIAFAASKDGASDAVDRPVSMTATQLAFQDELGAFLQNGRFLKDQANEFYGKAKIRVTLDDASETFWIRTIPFESVTDEQVGYLTRYVTSSKRQARVRLCDREIALGVALFVKKFTATFEPGSSTASSFSSLTRVLPEELTEEEQRQAILTDLEKDELIQMNRPGVLRAKGWNKVFWAYQDSYRGPFRPGDPEFDAVAGGKLLPGESTPRETIYHTIVTLNADPGRGMKYLGSLFIVWGTALLVYRRSNKKGAARAHQEESQADMETSNEESTPSSEQQTRAGKTTCAFLLTLVATFLASFQTLRVFADEIVPPTEREKIVAKRASDAIDWTPWRLLPVYDGGRRQPLNTFAEILVRDVAGSNAPTIVLPQETLERLDGDKPLNFPSLEEFLKDVEAQGDVAKDAQTKREEQKKWYDEVAKQAVERQKNVAERLRQIFPSGKRKFLAAELLFSWIVEPEVWEYVPFIDDPNGTVARDVLKRKEGERYLRAGRLAPEDFEQLEPGAQRATVDVFRSKAHSDPKLADAFKALDKFESRVSSFRSISFVPTQASTTRTQFYLNKILYGDAPTGMSFHVQSGSPLTKLDQASQNIERLLAREKRALRKESPFNDKEFMLRQKTPVAGDAQGRETLLLARQVAILASLSSKYPISTSGVLFERLLVNAREALDALQTHRDAIVAEEKFALEYRLEVQRAVSELDSIVDDLELACLAMTSEPPKPLAVSPVVRANLFRSTESQESPWLPLQTLLWASDVVYARFVDPTPTKKPDDDAQTSQDQASKDGERPLPKDRVKIEPFDDFETALTKSQTNSAYERPAAEAFLNAARAYRDRNADNRAQLVTESLKQFSDELLALGDRVEEKRVELATAAIPDETTRAEALAKTCYRVPRGLRAELFYYRLNAFYWNWIACLLALVAFVLSYVRQLLTALKKKGAERPQERFFFSLGLAFLTASCLVAFLGGAVRAYITGWAPVANMFETVVLLAFLIAAIAIGYATEPCWARPFANAWRATAFPSRKTDPSDKKIAWLMSAPRLLLIAFCFVVAFRVWRSGQTADANPFASLVTTLAEAFEMKGALDSVAVLMTFLFVVWSVPRFLTSLLALAFFGKKLCRRDDLRDEQTTTRRDVARKIADEIAQRKAFLTASSVIALLVAASAYFNSVEFNPHIRPLVAVLRSNFWLTIHVVAIIVSYALGAIAWVVAITSLTSYIFGKYGHDAVDASSVEPNRASRQERRRAQRDRAKRKDAQNESSVPKQGASDVNDFDPEYAKRVSPVVATMVRSAVLFLTAGIILGARWADFSWGRFWSWDPKEVWALVTLLIYLVVLHAHKISGGRRFVLALGANFGALAILMTWYGLSFVMGGGGRHAYASGESGKIAVLYILFSANILWAALAIARRQFEKAFRRGGKR